MALSVFKYNFVLLASSLITEISISALVIVAGTFALIFEINYFEEFSLGVYFGRLLATLIGFVIFKFISTEDPIIAILT